MYFAYYNNIPIGEIINLYTIDPLDKWLGNSNNDQWISQPFSAAINSPVPAVFRNHHVMCLLWLSSHGRAYYQIRQKTPWQPKTHQTILSYLHQQTCTVPLALSQGWSFLPGSDVIFSQHDVADPVQLLKFSCVKMGRFLIDPGLTGSFSLSYPMISGVIPPALGVPLILPLWAFQILSSKHSVVGLPRPGKFTFVTIPPFVLNNSLHLSAYSIHIINSGFSLHLFSPPPSPLTHQR